MNKNPPKSISIEDERYLKDFLIDFSEFLNNIGFNIGPRHLTQASDELKKAQFSQSKYILKPIFCSRPEQYINFYKTYNEYLTYRQKRTELKKQQQKLAENNQNAEARLKKLEEAQKKELKDSAEPTCLKIAKTKENTIQEEKNILKNILSNQKNFIKLSNGQYNTITKEEFKQMLEDILNAAQTELLKNNKKEYNKLLKIFNTITSIQKAVETNNKSSEEKAKTIHKKYQKHKDEIKQELISSKEEVQSIQSKLDTLLNEFKEKNKITIKSSACLSHRKIFIGCSSVQQHGKLTINEESFTKTFDKLKDEDKSKIKNYLKDNILHFKTKLSRNIHIIEKAQINMLETMQYACKTGGIPIELHYNRKKPSKTKLVLVLDISGSCREASATMLTFMHLLNSTFPKGTKAYVFVNTLYDISELMQNNNIDESIQQVFNTIPNRGIYSNYGKPIKQLWKEHRHEITSDSIVIFMGDARNNSYDPAYETFKNICRKAKRAYWLNTEEFKKWDKQDSVASGYAKYAKMYETINLNELIGFIQYGIK